MSQTAPASSNVRRISHLDLPGGGQVIVDGDYAYVGHMTPPYGTSIIDVADPKNPRIVDVKNPEIPEEVGYFNPEPVKGEASPQSNDVEVDDRGLIYLMDRNVGFDILEFDR